MQLPFVRVGEVSRTWKMLFNNFHSCLLNNRGLLVPGNPGLNSIQFQADGITEFEWPDPATHMPPKFNGLLPENPKFTSFLQADSHELQKNPLFIPAHLLLYTFSQFFLPPYSRISEDPEQSLHSIYSTELSVPLLILFLIKRQSSYWVLILCINCDLLTLETCR